MIQKHRGNLQSWQKQLVFSVWVGGASLCFVLFWLWEWQLELCLIKRVNKFLIRSMMKRTPSQSSLYLSINSMSSYNPKPSLLCEKVFGLCLSMHNTAITTPKGLYYSVGTTPYPWCRSQRCCEHSQFCIGVSAYLCKYPAKTLVGSVEVGY